MQISNQNNPFTDITIAPYPKGATPLTASSGVVANAAATATLTSVPGKTTYITGFQITGTGATVALAVTPTVLGTVGGTLSYTSAAIAGALLINQPLVVNYDPAIPATAHDVDIVVSCPALGLGATNNTVVAQGYMV